MNRKGFAISALIYGLSIMGILLMAILMGIMSVNRANNRKLSESIEEDLNRYSKTESTFSSAITTAQNFSVPDYEAGWYKIELMGAAGGNGSGGYGAYTSGIIELKEGDRLDFTVGKTSSTTGGNTKVEIYTGNGKKTIMVAAGGGKTSGADGGTLIGYNKRSTGGLVNITDGGKNYNLKSSSPNLIAYNAGAGQSYDIPSATNASEGTGGRSYIAGYAGCVGTTGYSGIVAQDTVDSDVVTSTPLNRTYYFIDGLMVPGVSKKNGSAKIERIVKKTSDSQTLTRKNGYLNNVTKIEDCADSAANVAKRITAIYKGKIIVSAAPTPTTGNCRAVNFGSTNIDEIAIWHGTNGKDIKNNQIKVNNNIVKRQVDVANTETPTGFRISAYQYDSTKALPSKGNYYIMPVLSENMVMTAGATLEVEHNDIAVEYLTGPSKQKWSVEKLTNLKVNPASDEYKIVELARFKALMIKNGLNIENVSTLFAPVEFNELSRNDPQIWKITAVGDGTYIIKTPIEPHDKGRSTGNIIPNMGNKKMIIGLNNSTTARFKLISVDYSG